MQNLELVETQPIKPLDHLLNSREVASMLNVDVSWVKNHCKKVKPLLPFVKLGDGPRSGRRFRRKDIIEFIEDNLVVPRKRA